MIPTLITLLVLALVLWVIFYVVGLFAPGIPQRIVGIILALVWLLACLRKLNVGLDL
jgi:hypothetical protein